MRQCTICEKTSVMAGRRSFLRSHYNPTTKVRKYPNIQWARTENGARVRACVRCIKTMAR